jgi:hypothetical protein
LCNFEREWRIRVSRETILEFSECHSDLEQPSERSRAARRRLSISETDVSATNEAGRTGKSLVQEKIAELSVRGTLPDTDDKPKGITKKKNLSSKQKRRKQQAVVKAEMFKDVLERKVSESKEKLKKIKDRKKTTPK